jgi:predicted PurR-regulated permease PerM
MGSALKAVLLVGAVAVGCYVGRPVLIPLLLAAFLAITLQPVVGFLERHHVPRTLGALFALLTLIAALWGAGRLLYGRAADLVHSIPSYTHELRGMVQKLKAPAEKVQETTQKVLSPGPEPRSTVRVAQPFDWASALHSLGTVGEVLLAVSFVPFLVFFMLSGEHRLRATTVGLFAAQAQPDASGAIDEIAAMMRRFIFGNVLLGAFLSAASALLFWRLHLPNALVLGIVSGFLSLIPYLGGVVSPLLPLAAGIGILSTVGALIILFGVMGLHIFAFNVAYPKVVGARLQLNPLAATLSLLVWAGLWGPIGLVFGVPITAALKVACDRSKDRSLQAWGAWLGAR